VIDLGLLRKKIDESGMTMVAIASKSGILRETLYNRLNGKSDFSVSEMVALCDTLHLQNEDRERIFFAPEVE